MNLKQVFLFFGLFFISSFTQGQVLAPFESLKRAILFHYKSNSFSNDNLIASDSAKFYFENFLTNVNKNDPNFGLGVFYASQFYFDKEEFNKAEKLLKLFLDLKPPKQYQEFRYKDEFVSELDPNYYYRFVYEQLNEISLNKKEYGLALDYIRLAEKSSFQHFCVNAYSTRRPFLAYRKAKSFIGLNQPDSALKVLLPHIFQENFSENAELVETAVSLLKAKFNGNTFNIVNNAFKNISSKKIRYDKTKFTIYFVELDRVIIEVPTPLLVKFNEADYKDYIFSSRFYKQIKE
ncbi:hypothetical protein I5M27_09130 [Adhaeribacter sp. BT258]|uniref:Tetratricopeptide repeat-containing protein n=1 Tax=Adhaeribacter terrigena TaxID=2793070 RepID=A0ABS1C1U2_9BACT|nr:hypothetical protein [Adhaeribacter terrigena]MBK0403146.1 hypothetical protein [Adhaeribacter terrigena]